MMGERCPSALFAGGYVSISAGGYADCCTAVVAAAGEVGVEACATKFGSEMVGAPAQAERIRLRRRRQFKV